VTRLLPIATLVAVLGITAGFGTPAAVAQSSDASPAPKIAENPAITARAKTEFLAWQSGKVDLKRYSTKAASTFTDTTVSSIQPQLQALGKLKSFTYKATAKAQGDTVYAYLATCSGGAATMTFVVDAHDKVDGVFFHPQ
jgi:hypothetical protein